jgi:hypothetical protein
VKSRLPLAIALAVTVIHGFASDVAQARFPEDARSLDTVVTVDGRRRVGLIESESEAWVNLIEIQRRPGRPMFLVIRPIDRSRVEQIVRLAPAERERLRHEVDQFLNRAAIEAGRMEAVRLDTTQRAGIRYYHYAGRWFSLDASTDEATARRIIVRVEQVFTAYRQILPPRQPAARPLNLIVCGSLEEYRQYLAQLGLKIENRACFLEQANLLLAGTELALVAAELERVSVAHQRLRSELEALERRLPERLQRHAEHLKRSGLGPAEIARLLNQEKQKANREIGEHQRQLQAYDRKNARDFEKATAQMFVRLYHEAFHAYLENYVFPRARYHVPRWLNEGLAVMLEGGQLESGALRVDAPERNVLRRLKSDLGGDPLPLAKLLEAGAEAFAQTEHADADHSTRYYAAAWGLAYYLAFERNLLVDPRLAAYVTPAPGQSPQARFEQLVGMPLARFEPLWQRYIRGL